MALAIIVQLINSPPVSAEQFVSNCKMDTCRWFKIEKREIAGQSSEGELLKLRYREWESHHPNATYNKKYPRKNMGTAPTYIFCSKTRPAIIFQVDEKAPDKGWNVFLLTPREEASIAGANLLAHMLYFNACHGINFELKEISFSKLSKKLGYAEIESPDDDYVTNDPMTLLGPRK